ncbi:exonuclease I [[Haemophilus] ducreyi]|uniref:Exodeoxyribonuclease I n=2 Tax=Haemophilus ducreyi TaxID=730 RepID=Q7VLL6_HAEDU|nr:exodeoxyribonuclease I [[Haemophilus] ducreyi]AAP96219.1 exonuclease I [[Haemophilus] ducreyi 35000HP]AKO31174.1 exonuclease I [[Haemophilus] ducreyi]AKO32621.1 exonuclease I [[Haemophilus] ducreyi]AKO34071.1 exonuclease I [[Haemophilus] ducreyi]AKO35517.1 exonuclease I [[Haemophilus] ducreyi]
MNNDFTFFFYDYESFGINPATDRPAQFAGIRTDREFNIIGEPVMFYCKQTNDYLPSAEAVMVTGIAPQLCNEKGLSEPEFAQRIHHEFSQPNTCIIGYNNIRYDDEMTRYTFFRNFYDPYEYCWKNGNSRWDLLDLVRACYALRPSGIEWPKNEKDEPSFKLEHLTKANAIAHQNAHDAMADVYATIEIAKLIKQKQRKLFDFFFENRSKKALEKLIDPAELTPLVHVSGMLGNYRGNTALIVPLAWHPTNQNAVVVCDLSSDIQGLLNDTAEVLKQRLYTKRDALAEHESPVPLKLVHLNKCPILAPAKTLLAENAMRLAIDRSQCLLNLAKLQAQKAVVREKVIEIFNDERIFAPSNNVETTLYDSFFSNGDKNNLAILRTLKPEQLAEHGLKFADKRVEPLLFHYRARHFPNTLTRAEQIKWQKYCHQQIDAKTEQFSQEIANLFERYADHADKVKLLEDLTAYATQLSQYTLPLPSAAQKNQLMAELNKVAEQQIDKAIKLDLLKTLIK